MSCGCKSQPPALSWNDLMCRIPTDPRDVLAMARLGVGLGEWFLSSNYHQPAGSSMWIASPIVFGGPAVITTNTSDEQQMVFEATSWNQANRSVMLAATTAPPLRKTIFLRAGVNWSNGVALNLGTSTQFTELQLSMLENAATRGDAQGTIPVFRWPSGPYSGSQILNLVFYNPGRYTLGLMGINNNSTPDYSMFEMDVIAV